MTKISIIIPLYNKYSYILETVGSVICQTYTDWEMLVVDNGSTDDGFEKVKQVKDSRISFLECSKKGPGAARNYGLDRAQGEWIQFLDADDLLEPNHLEQQLQVARQNPNSEIIVGGWKEFVGFSPTKFVLKKPAGFEQPRQSLLDSTIAFAPWAVHAALVKRSVLTAEYLWAEELDSFASEDTAFWFGLLTKFSVAFSNNQGALYRKQTHLCRDEYSNATKWLQGMRAVTSYNIQFLHSRGDKISANQCEMLMRCFISTAFIAYKSRDFITEREAFDCAEKWFVKCAELGGINTFPLYIRWIFGLRLVQKLLFVVSSFQQSLANVLELPYRSLMVNE